MKHTSALLLTTALIAGEARAFWGKGHLLVARIAEYVLETKDKDVLDLALKELSTLPQSHPDMIVHEKDHPFTECATFADDIKPTFGGFQNDWHFIDQAYLDEPDTTLDDFDFVAADVDVVSALTDLKAFLQGSQETTSQYIT